MTDVRAAFESIDSDGDAKIDLLEFRKLAAKLGIELDAAGVEELFDNIDKSENGLIDVSEFEAWWPTSGFAE
ncbi:MAG: hypothetical protein DRJ42_20985 [Deltaproteobacteria bacterium]|nr:MAG: hypothetical protein DRJ42_20985 [Deltaproteobacteria bacterium]